MAITEKIYIISDIEMGRRDITDDFSDDHVLVDFINKINSSNPGGKITLVLNGDIIDFLKMAYHGHYPRHITEEISSWKLNEVITKHPIIFDALKNFLTNPHHFLHFVIGNHDADLIWPSLQKKLKQILDQEQRVTFNYHYQNKDLHAEHGHLLDSFFSFNVKTPIIKYKKKDILKLPWGSHACFTHLNHLKIKFPAEERMFPKPMVLQSNKTFRKESKKTIYKLMLKEILLNPVIRFYDQTYRAPYLKFIKHFFHHGLEVVDDRKFIKRFIRQLSRQQPDKKILVLGHAHVLGAHDYNNQKFLITDTWRDEIDLTKNGQKKPKSYAEITYQGNNLQNAELKTFTT
jgi:hypothetical protein